MGKAWTRVKVWCDMGAGKTFFPVKKGKRVIPYNSKVRGTCADFGMAMPNAKFISKAAKAHFAKHHQIAHAEPGKYIIEFHTIDKNLNKECKSVKRTVIVRDTLPPIIKLKIGKVIRQKSKGGQKGINGVVNNPK